MVDLPTLQGPKKSTIGLEVISPSAKGKEEQRFGTKQGRLLRPESQPGLVCLEFAGALLH